MKPKEIDIGCAIKKAVLCAVLMSLLAGCAKATPPKEETLPYEMPNLTYLEEDYNYSMDETRTQEEVREDV